MREMCPLLPIAYEQAPYWHPPMLLAALIHVFVVVSVFLGELQGIDTIAKRDYPGWVRAGVVHEVLQPVGLEAKTDGQHDVRFGHLGDVACSWNDAVRIATRRMQTENLDSVPTYHLGPVGHDVGGRHHLQERGRWRGRGRVPQQQ